MLAITEGIAGPVTLTFRQASPQHPQAPVPTPPQASPRLGLYILKGIPAKMTPRRFPPPWQIEEREEAFIVHDASGQALAYVYFASKSKCCSTCSQEFSPIWRLI